GLQIGLVLDQLLGAPVQQADMRIDALYQLPVKLQNKPQHTVRRRVHRAEVDGEIADFSLRHWLSPELLRRAIGSRQSAIGGSTLTMLDRADQRPQHPSK